MFPSQQDRANRKHGSWASSMRLWSADLVPWKQKALLEVSCALELLSTLTSSSHPICWAPPGFFPFSLWSLMCGGNTVWKDNVGAVQAQGSQDI